MLDIFKTDAFGLMTLTAGINLLPVVPQRIGAMNLFKPEGIPTTTVGIESVNGKLNLIPTQPRGTMPEAKRSTKRIVRNFSVPHLPLNDTVLADALQNVRAFGSNDNSEAVASVVNSKMAALKQDHEVTWEWHRCGALKGQIVDADGTTPIYNLFTEFGIVEQVFTFVPGTTNDIKNKCLALKRAMEIALGSQGFTGIHCLCSPEFYDGITGSADVKDAFALYQDGAFKRMDNRTGFEMFGIVFEEYNARMGATRFIPANEARFFPIGVPGLFKRYNAPGTFIETVNTIGLEMYAKQEVQKFDTGIDLHTQSNPLHMCVLPQCLMKGTL